MIFKQNTANGHNSVNNVGEVMAPYVCKLSDHALYLHFVIIPQRVLDVLSGHDFLTKIYKRAKFRTERK